VVAVVAEHVVLPAGEFLAQLLLDLAKPVGHYLDLSQIYFAVETKLR
jgi:hypothetical protein